MMSPEVCETEEQMTEITMIVDEAEAVSNGLADFAEQFRQVRSSMKAQAQTVVEVWKCDAELEFQSLHDNLLMELEKNINALLEIRRGLDSAIALAKAVDQDF
jgi:uncharacterized protein YukE